MTKIMKGGVAYNTTSNMVALTQAEYNALSTAQKNNGNFYFITDADPSYFSAENIDYDNTDSGLIATDVQGAIDEIAQGGGGGGKQTALTQAQYDALVDAGTVDPTTEYFITDANALGSISLRELVDTNISATPTAGQTMVYSGSSWENGSYDYTNLSNKPSVDSALSLSSTNAVQNTAVTKSMFFGDVGMYYSRAATNIDTMINDSGIAAQRYFSIDNANSITGQSMGNHQFMYGWLNDTKKYGWIMICSFYGCWFGVRRDSTTFTITKID